MPSCAPTGAHRLVPSAPVVGPSHALLPLRVLDRSSHALLRIPVQSVVCADTRNTTSRLGPGRRQNPCQGQEERCLWRTGWDESGPLTRPESSLQARQANLRLGPLQVSARTTVCLTATSNGRMPIVVLGMAGQSRLESPFPPAERLREDRSEGLDRASSSSTPPRSRSKHVKWGFGWRPVGQMYDHALGPEARR